MLGTEVGTAEVILVEAETKLDSGDEVDAALEKAVAAAAEVIAGIGEKGVALARFKKPAVRLPAGHPSSHSDDLQQPKNGGFVAAQVYQRLPGGHCSLGIEP